MNRSPRGKVVQVGAKAEGVAIDPASRVAAVAVQDPDRLVLVDDRTGRRLREVPLPGSARHVALARPGGPFLVPVETANVLVEVDPRSGRTRTTRVGDHPHDAAAVGDRIFTADEFGATMSVVRGGRLAGQVPVDAQPGGIVAIGHRVAVVSVRAYDVELYDGRSDRPRGLGAQSGGLGPSHVATGPGGRLLIADTRGRALMVYDTRPRLRFRARIPLPGTPVGVACGGWVALSERAQVVRVDPATGRITERVRTVRDPYSLAVDPAAGRLAVASHHDGTLQLVTP